jgi:hypothetical protein
MGNQTVDSRVVSSSDRRASFTAMLSFGQSYAEGGRGQQSVRDDATQRRRHEHRGSDQRSVLQILEIRGDLLFSIFEYRRNLQAVA